MNESGNPLEKVLSTDGTGDHTSMKVNYESRRRRQRSEKDDEGKKGLDAFPSTEGKHDLQYSVFAVDVHSKIISGFSTTDDHSIGELSHFPSVMSQTVDICLDIETMLGDSLYANRNACALTDSYGITPHFLPKSNATFRAKGVRSWKGDALLPHG